MKYFLAIVFFSSLASAGIECEFTELDGNGIRQYTVTEYFEKIDSRWDVRKKAKIVNMAYHPAIATTKNKDGNTLAHIVLNVYFPGKEGARVVHHKASEPLMGDGAVIFHMIDRRKFYGMETKCFVKN
ncbi:MAG: hypothetical protein AB8E15_06180 [Bdellovibrionales bacterium]